MIHFDDSLAGFSFRCLCDDRRVSIFGLPAGDPKMSGFIERAASVRTA